VPKSLDKIPKPPQIREQKIESVLPPCFNASEPVREAAIGLSDQVVRLLAEGILQSEFNGIGKTSRRRQGTCAVARRIALE
jgi:hypothetical protein